MTATDHDLDDHIRRTLRAVAETVTLSDDDAPLPAPAGPRRAGRPLLLAVAAVVLLASVAVALARPFGGDEHVDVASQVPEPGAGPPRLLVTAPGWEVTRADEASADRGEMTFRGPEGSLALSWERGRYERRLEQLLSDVDTSDAVEQLHDLTVAGHRAAVIRYDEGRPVYTALWGDGGYAVRLVGQLSDAGSFRDLAATIEAVDTETWLAAMPASVVRPADRAEVVEQMLADIPLPPDYDRAALIADDGLVVDRYQLAARVTELVACGWVGQWVDATAMGDTATAQQSVDAMSTSFQWDILLEPQREGLYPQLIWEFATAIAGDGTVDSASGRVPVADVYAGPGGLGCTTG